jgi:hypothetical protein
VEPEQSPGSGSDIQQGGFLRRKESAGFAIPGVCWHGRFDLGLIPFPINLEPEEVLMEKKPEQQKEKQKNLEEPPQPSEWASSTKGILGRCLTSAEK